MNAPLKGVSAKADRAATPDGAEPVPVSGIAGITDATALWDALGKTDPKHTKSFSRAGGFKGTALKPMWALRRLTETFGPVGYGWGYDKPTFQVVEAGGEVLVYATVGAWIGANRDRDGDPVRFYGVGGDKVLTKRQSGQFVDDEAFKKAFTDALMNAFKHLGVGADIHMGQYDDSKYVAAVTREFAEGASNGEPDKAHPKAARGKDAPFPQGPAKNKTELKALGRDLWRDVEACGDDDTLAALMGAEETKALIKQLRDALPDWWDGGTRESGEPFEGLGDVIDRKTREFQLENAQ